MRRSLGLEIGAAGVRWVELEEERGRHAVRFTGTVAWDGAGEWVAGDSEPLLRAPGVRALAAERRWRGREVVVSLPRSAVTLRWITLPQAPREETAGMVELEAVQSLPFPTEEAAWDFVAFPTLDGRQEVLMVAARRQLVQQLRRQVEAAGLRIAAVSVDTLAATALWREVAPEAESGAVLLHLEGEIATISSVQGGRLLLSRSVTPERLDAETLAVEVRRTLVAGMMSGARGQTPAAVGAVWLTGGGADAALAEELETILLQEAGERGRSAAAEPSAPPVRPAKVALLSKTRLPGGEELPPSLDTALGLALLGLRPPTERLDLARALRVETERRASGPARRLPLLAAAGAAAMGVAFLLLFGPGAGDRELAAAASRAQADVRQMASRRKQLEDQVQMLSGAVTPAHSYLDVLNDVSALAGPDVWLTQYTYDRGRPIVIRGTAKSSEAMARFVEGLRRSPHLDRVALGAVSRAETDKTHQVSVLQFAVTGALRGDRPLEPRRSRRARSTTTRQEG